MNKTIKLFVIAFLISAILGFVIAKLHPELFKKDSKISVENTQGEKKEVGTSDKVVLETANLQEKLLPTATLILEKKYEDCKHIVKVESELPVEMINLTEEQVKEIYSDWIVKDFSKDNVTLYKIEEGICNKHFVIGDVDGIVTVFRLDKEYNKSLYEKTDIYTKFLPDEDKNRLKEGIYVYSNSELNSELENFE